MWKFILGRTLQSAFVLFIVASVAFILMHLMPGNPWATLGMSEEEYKRVEELKHAYGMDLPIYMQYFRWLKGLLHGDLGYGYNNMTAINLYIWKFAKNSVILLGTAWIITLMIAIPWGIHNSRKPYGISDRVAFFLGFIGFSVPAFVLGYWLQQLFAMQLFWLPPSSMHTPSKEGQIGDLILHLILPATTVALGMLAYYLKFIKDGMLEVLDSDYLMTARAKGASERRVVYRHALKNALIPIITLMALDIPSLVAGSAIVENVFNWNGLGRLMVGSALQRDYTVLVAIILIVSTFIVLINWLTDIVYTIVDPRVRVYGRKVSVK